jgi:hypothetical protein
MVKGALTFGAWFISLRFEAKCLQVSVSWRYVRSVRLPSRSTQSASLSPSFLLNSQVRPPEQRQLFAVLNNVVTQTPWRKLLSKQDNYPRNYVLLGCATYIPPFRRNQLPQFSGQKKRSYPSTKQHDATSKKPISSHVFLYEPETSQAGQAYEDIS